MRRWLVLLIPVVLVLAGCSTEDFSGVGNEFDITATIDHTGSHSITVYDVHVNAAQGAAAKWDWKGTHQIHDNYTNDSDTDIHVGYICAIDDCSQVLPPSYLHRGDRVHVLGKIRNSKDGKSYDQRPVYDSVQVTK